MGLGTSSHVSFSCKALYSFFISCFQWGSDNAFKQEVGIGDICSVVVAWRFKQVTGLVIPHCDRVCMGCMGGRGGGGCIDEGIGCVGMV